MLTKIIISGTLALIVLTCVVVLYGYSGVHIANPSKATDYTWEPNQYMSIMKEGFSWNFADENGFHNMPELADKTIDILLMGDSHMEGFNVSTKDTTASLLNDYLPYTTYNIGTSGHYICNCVKNMRSAMSMKSPKCDLKYVILQTNSVNPDIEEMNLVLEGSYPAIPSYDSGILYTLQKTVPAVKTLHHEINNWIDASDVPPIKGAGIMPENVQKLASEPETDCSYMDDEYERILDLFLKMAAEPVEEVGAKLILLYIPGVNDKVDDSVFAEKCKNNGIIYVSMKESFDTYYENERIMPYGFANTPPGKGHINIYGHKLVAEKLAEIIIGTEN